MLAAPIIFINSIYQVLAHGSLVPSAGIKEYNKQLNYFVSFTYSFIATISSFPIFLGQICIYSNVNIEKRSEIDV